MDYLQINHPCISIKFHDIKIICIFHYLYFHKNSYVFWSFVLAYFYLPLLVYTKKKNLIKSFIKGPNK
ncbi:hypothetical protein HanXRQr2_Chr04g0153441 [Helianthus annuus]|uniref:Uncharacterized protein n=1 Tax=Helianthus annuus TaxID=4232 RepID=A0A9K3J573_HELAN|nr:hypothetical protein HanXRQr2_Chr04g0153441 [Helianthus annuus]KAJ0930301.1 hypothetical protein HanPSC8_Chr04g0147741 [Helianthus annuus]